jgi:hypothetical protein
VNSGRSEEQRAKAREYYRKNKARVLKNNESWKQTHPEYYLWHSARQRAKQDGLEFSLPLSSIRIPVHCPALGVELKWKSGDSTPTLDRVDNTKGYVRGNVQVISKKANRMKNNATQEELRRFAEWVLATPLT